MLSGIKILFAFVDYSNKQQLMLSPVRETFVSAMLLRNCLVTLKKTKHQNISIASHRPSNHIYIDNGKFLYFCNNIFLVCLKFFRSNFAHVRFFRVLEPVHENCFSRKCTVLGKQCSGVFRICRTSFAITLHLL